MRVPKILSLLYVLFSLVMLGCRAEPGQGCTSPRRWSDSVGEFDERARIQIQWARIQGGYDSLASTMDGKLIVDRAAGSLARNEARYRDSIVSEDGLGMSADGCVDWRTSWAEGAFDRQAMATVLVKRLSLDTGLGAVEFRLDTDKDPIELEVEASPSVASSEHGLRTVTFRIDSVGIRLVQP